MRNEPLTITSSMLEKRIADGAGTWSPAGLSIATYQSFVDHGE